MNYKILKIFHVKWAIDGGGSYIPPDPCSGGDYYSNLHGSDILPATSKKDAREILIACRPNAKVKSIDLIKEFK